MKSHTKTFFLNYYISYETARNVKPLYLITNEINRYIKESNGNKYLTLVPTDESKDILKKYEELWNKTRGLIRSVTYSLDNYNEKYMKVKFNSDNDLPLKKTLELSNMIIAVNLFFMKARNTIHKFS